MTTKNLLVELFVEELPPKALKKLGEAFASVLADSLSAQGLAGADSVVTHFASPRRLAVHVTAVAARAPDKSVVQKVMPINVGLDLSNHPSQALVKKMAAFGVQPTALEQLVAALRETPIQQLREALEALPEQKLLRALDGKVEALYYRNRIEGATLATGLQKALEDAIAKLPIPKVMTYQLESGCELPGWSSVSFVRPAHSLIALHGADVVPVQALGLKAGNSTQGHRFEAKVSPVVLKDADSYAATLAQDGAVIASFAERRAEIVRQLAAAAAKLGGGVKAIEDDTLLDEVTGLVERPNVLVCEFEKEFLEVPQECLILTMKANQKYFPLLDASGKLTNKFLVVSNISPADASAVIGGNERVVRPRLADAKFFFDQDRKRTLASRFEGLAKVVYHNELGTQGERAGRVTKIAAGIVQLLGKGEADVALLDDVVSAAKLAKTDLLTDMVGEFPELQGTMGRYYARNDGLSVEVADAIEDHYKPRFAGDTLPRSDVGIVVALADKLETLVGMFAIGNIPTGDKDPFALRRHALGVTRMLSERNVPLHFFELLNVCKLVFDEEARNNSGVKQGLVLLIEGKTLPRIKIDPETVNKISSFIYDRLAGSLREQGYSAQEVDAVVSQRPQRLGDIPKRLAAVRDFAALPEAPALAAANKRISNILKKAEGVVEAKINETLLKEPAEIALANALKSIAPHADKAWAEGQYAENLQALAALKGPVDAFFESVMVNAEDPALKANRLGLLATLHAAMNRVADLSKLAS